MWNFARSALSSWQSLQMDESEFLSFANEHKSLDSISTHEALECCSDNAGALIQHIISFRLLLLYFKEDFHEHKKLKDQHANQLIYLKEFIRDPSIAKKIQDQRKKLQDQKQKLLDQINLINDIIIGLLDAHIGNCFFDEDKYHDIAEERQALEENTQEANPELSKSDRENIIEKFEKYKAHLHSKRIVDCMLELLPKNSPARCYYQSIIELNSIKPEAPSPLKNVQSFIHKAKNVFSELRHFMRGKINPFYARQQVFVNFKLILDPVSNTLLEFFTINLKAEVSKISATSPEHSKQTPTTHKPANNKLTTNKLLREVIKSRNKTIECSNARFQHLCQSQAGAMIIDYVPISERFQYSRHTKMAPYQSDILKLCHYAHRGYMPAILLLARKTLGYITGSRAGTQGRSVEDFEFSVFLQPTIHQGKRMTVIDVALNALSAARSMGFRDASLEIDNLSAMIDTIETANKKFDPQAKAEQHFAAWIDEQVNIIEACRKQLARGEELNAFRSKTLPKAIAIIEKVLARHAETPSIHYEDTEFAFLSKPINIAGMATTQLACLQQTLASAEADQNLQSYFQASRLPIEAHRLADFIDLATRQKTSTETWLSMAKRSLRILRGEPGVLLSHDAAQSSTFADTIRDEPERRETKQAQSSRCPSPELPTRTKPQAAKGRERAHTMPTPGLRRTSL